MRTVKTEALQQLRNLIETDAPATGDRLPSERQLTALIGCSRETLRTALAVLEAEGMIWRHVGQVRLQMRDVSDAYLSAYVARNWEDIRHSVGAYQLEREGIRLFTAIDGDYFTVLGMPLLQVLNFLALRGDIET